MNWRIQSAIFKKQKNSTYSNYWCINNKFSNEFNGKEFIGSHSINLYSLDETKLFLTSKLEIEII